MARKDVRLMIEEAERHGVGLAVMPLVAALYDQAITRGEGLLDTTAAFRFPAGT
jgi:3-hydroxyisobutyrate dehydrogenase-like beta-hydroxyacid dehydrogenase